MQLKIANVARLTRLKVVVLCMVCAASGAFAADDTFKTSYACFNTEGNVRWAAVTEITAMTNGNGRTYMLTEKGSGLQSGFKSAVSWVARLEFESDDKVVRPLKMDREVFDGSGRLIFTESQRFDFGSKKAIFSSENILSGKRQKKEFRFSGDVVNRLILGLYARRLLEQGKREAQLELLSGEPRLYKFKLYVMDTEAIDINGSMKNAYKLCLDPELGLLNIAKILLPKAYVWHSAKPKFEWLRYEGLESGLNSPMVQIRTSERSL